MLCGICLVQIQPRKLVLDHAGYTVPTRQHELSGRVLTPLERALERTEWNIACQMSWY